MASDGSSSNSGGMKSPSISKPANGHSFASPSALDVSLPAPPDPTLDPAAYLRSIYAVRARCGLVYQRAKRNQLNHFDVDGSKFGETAAYLVSIIKVGHSMSKSCPTDSFFDRETMPQTTTRSPLMDDGNISKPVADPE